MAKEEMLGVTVLGSSHEALEIESLREAPGRQAIGVLARGLEATDGRGRDRWPVRQVLYPRTAPYS